MVGNDLVDLDLARQSNWQRKGYLDKICSQEEQQLILQAPVPFQMLWLLWTMKEAAYKIVNRLTGIRSYSPLNYTCKDLHIEGVHASGQVLYQQSRFFTHSESSSQLIHSIAVSKESDFDNLHIRHFDNTVSYTDEFNRSSSLYHLSKDKAGIPRMTHLLTGKRYAASLSHHGRFLAVIYSDSLLLTN